MVLMAIFRVPDPDPETQDQCFVQLMFKDGELETTGRVFIVDPADSYCKMTWSQVVFAKEVEPGVSDDLGWYTFFDEANKPAIVHEMDGNDLIVALIAVLTHAQQNLVVSHH